MERITLDNYDLKGTCRICEINGPYPGNITGIDNIHFNTWDDYRFSPYNNPCVIPIKGFNYSFKKSIYFEVFDWNTFKNILGITRIWDIAICTEDYSYEYDVKFLINPPTKINQYREAKGIVGVTGDSIVDNIQSTEFDKYLFTTPYIISNKIHSEEFKTDLATLQVQIGPNAMQGNHPFPRLYVSGVID